MSNVKQEIDNFVEQELPDSFTSDEIWEMYTSVNNDIEKLRLVPGMNESKMGMILQQKHRKFAFSYSSIFMKLVKGEMKPEMFKSMLSLKKKLDTKEITLEQARNGVIDGAKKDIENNPKETRVKKVPKKGSVVQEVNIKCKPDDF